MRSHNVRSVCRYLGSFGSDSLPQSSAQQANKQAAKYATMVLSGASSFLGKLTISVGATIGVALYRSLSIHVLTPAAIEPINNVDGYTPQAQQDFIRNMVSDQKDESLLWLCIDCLCYDKTQSKWNTKDTPKSSAS